jgi:hypothetical protein
MKLIDVFNAAEGRVCDGSDYQWHCYGSNARLMDFADADGQEFCTLVFDCKTYEVYEIDVFVPGYDQCFKWWNPEYRDSYINEAKVRNINPLCAFDNVYFTEVDKEVIMTYLKDVSATYYDELPVPEDA